jgi:hypothetical protein
VTGRQVVLVAGVAAAALLAAAAVLFGWLCRVAEECR